MSGKVVVNRCMSLDGFVAGPGHAMDFAGRPVEDFVDRADVAEIAAATGAMLIGRRTWDVGASMQADQPDAAPYPFDGPMFLLTHRPLAVAGPQPVVLSGDIADAVGTALAAAGGKDLELLGSDVAGQALARGLVDEVLVYVLPVLLGDGIPVIPHGQPRTDLEPLSSKRSGESTILRFRVRRTFR